MDSILLGTDVSDTVPLDVFVLRGGETDTLHPWCPKQVGID